MRFPVIGDISTKDGDGNQNARLTNTLAEAKKNGTTLATVRPGLNRLATSSGNGNNLVCFGGELVNIYGNTVYAAQFLGSWQVDYEGIGTIASPSGMFWRSVAYGNGVFVAVPYVGSTNKFVVSSDGVNWLPVTVAAYNITWNHIIWNGSQFLAVGTNSLNVATSSDGYTWAHITTGPPSGGVVNIAWNGSVYCAPAYPSSYVDVSADGVTWNSHASPISMFDIAWNGSVFCGIKIISNQAATSPDGVSWTLQTMPSSAYWNTITWNGSVFLATTSGATTIATSADGESWASGALPTGFDTASSSMVAIGNLFCCVDNDGLQIAVSEDGVVWDVVAISATGNFKAGASDGAGVCFVGYSNDTVYLALTDENPSLTSVGTVTNSQFDFALIP